MADKRKDWQKEIEELSLEELGKKIKKDKKKVMQNTVLIIAAAFVLIALCIAWFVSNNRDFWNSQCKILGDRDWLRGKSRCS